ncbi:MAG: hypothetical protein PHO75_02420 [Candidatus Shapirobacteria bacterium]|nr:hypothetical protein [Candidatus Shapirobacteria bacterium]
MDDKLYSELNKGTWSAATAYTIGDFVDLNGSSYVCIANNTNQTPPNATYWALLASKGDQGDPGEEIELQVADGYIQWKYTSDVSWTNLIAVSSLIGATGPKGDKGDTGDAGTEIELQNTGTYIQWRYIGGEWTNLVALSVLVGPQGEQGIQGEKGSTWKGDWSSATAYVVDDIVYRLGSSYICTAENTNQEPPNASYWDLVALKGTDGEGAGDVMGPASSISNNVVLFDGVTGKLIKDSGETITQIKAASIPIGYLDTDGSLAGNSDVKVASQKATKTYADTKIAKTTNITSLNETGIADGEIAIFNLTNKDIRTSNVTIATTLGADDTTIPTSKAVKDVTDALVLKSLYDANSILMATTDNTPVAITIAEQTVIGRITGGAIKALSTTEIRTLINVADGATANVKATGAEINTGTDDSKFATPKAIADSILKNSPQGFLINGKIVPSVSSNNLTVEIKGLDGNDPSATNPVYCRIGDNIRSITSALSVTKNAGTNWFNSGSAELATFEVDYFVYLGYNTTDGVTIGFSRIPWGKEYDDFNATSTNEKYCAISTITHAASGDDYELIGRFAAILSAGAGYTWTVPTFSNKNLIQRPIYETRLLTFNSVLTNVTEGNGTKTAQYVLNNNKTVFLNLEFILGNTSSVSSVIFFSIPFAQVGSSFLNVLITDAGTGYINAAAVTESSSSFAIKVSTVSTYVIISTNTSATVPMTWTTNDSFKLKQIYITS